MRRLMRVFDFVANVWFYWAHLGHPFRRAIHLARNTL